PRTGRTILSSSPSRWTSGRPTRERGRTGRPPSTSRARSRCSRQPADAIIQVSRWSCRTSGPRTVTWASSIAHTRRSRALSRCASRRLALTPDAERPTADDEAAAAQDTPQLWLPPTDLAKARIELDRSDEARQLLERALAIAKQAQAADYDLADARATL